MQQLLLEGLCAKSATIAGSIDITGILPPQLPSGKKILWKDAGEGKVEIYCDRYGVRGGQPKPITINRYIPVCELLFEGFGLWAGDGKKRRYLDTYSTFGFANTEIELHRYFLKFSELLGIHTECFRARVSVPSYLSNSLATKEERISNELKINKSSFFRGDVNETRNYTFVDIVIQASLLGYILKILHDKLVESALVKKNFAAAYLRGVIACEANVHVRTDKRDQLGEINIGANDPEERALYRKLIESLGIECSKDKTIPHDGAILIHGRTNFEKAAYWKLCDLHPKKRERFYFGTGNFRSFQYRKGEAKKLILRSLMDGKSKTAKELAEELKMNIGTIKSEHLFKLVKMGLVAQSKPMKIGRVHKKFYSLTETGRKIAGENKNLF